MEIKADHISKYYSDGPVASKGLDDVSLSIPSGSFVSISGPSGSGKSTLLRVLTMQIAPDEGELWLDGANSDSMGMRERAIFFRDRASYVPFDGDLAESLSAIDNCMAPLLFKGVPLREARAAARRSLSECGLSGKEGRKPRMLSGGERVRVAIARALCSGREVLAFDEATGNLDASSASEVVSLVGRISGGRTVLWASHSPCEVAGMASERIEMGGGRIASDERVPKPSNRAEAAAPNAGSGFHGGSTFIGMRAFMGKRRKAASTLAMMAALSLSSLLCSHFVSYFAGSVSSPGAASYSFRSHLGSRLLVESGASGLSSASLCPSSAYVDEGDLFGGLLFRASLGRRSEGLFAFPSAMAAQPIMPPAAERIMGEGLGDGFAIAASNPSFRSGQLDFDAFEGHLGDVFSVFESSLFVDGYPIEPARLTFDGAYYLPPSSFSSDSSKYSLILSEGGAGRLRESLLSELEQEASGSMGKSGAYLGEVEPDGLSLALPGRRSAECLGDEEFALRKSVYESSLGEGFPSGSIFLSESLKGEDGARFLYRGSEIAVSSFPASEAVYLGWPFKDGEWHVSGAAAKRQAVRLSLESSAYYEDEGSMASDEALVSSKGGVSRRASESSSKASEPTELERMGAMGAGLIAALFMLMVFALARLSEGRSFKRGAEERSSLQHSGAAPSSLWLMESAPPFLAYIALSGVLIPLYLSFVPGGAALMVASPLVYALFLAMGLSLTPLLAPFPKGGDLYA